MAWQRKLVRLTLFCVSGLFKHPKLTQLERSHAIHSDLGVQVIVAFTCVPPFCSKLFYYLLLSGRCDEASVMHNLEDQPEKPAHCRDGHTKTCRTTWSSHWKPIVEDMKDIQTLELEFWPCTLEIYIYIYMIYVIFTHMYPLGFNYISLDSWGSKEMSQESSSCPWFVMAKLLHVEWLPKPPKRKGTTVQPCIFATNPDVGRKFDSLS